MRRLTTKQRTLGGALLVVVAAWAVDWLTRAAGPQPAQATESTPGLASAAPADWEDVSELVARLTQTRYVSVEEELRRLQRDLFRPGPLFDVALKSAESQRAEQPPEPQDADPPEPAFEDRHELQGIVMGRTPLAVVDDQLVPLRCELDGYTLVEVQRDYVVFQQPVTQIRVTLELRQRPKKP